MGLIRTTITLDESLAARVKQMFKGNLSRGINELLTKHLIEENSDEGFGLLKGRIKVSSDEIIEMRREDEKSREKLYR